MQISKTSSRTALRNFGAISAISIKHFCRSSLSVLSSMLAFTFCNIAGRQSLKPITTFTSFSWFLIKAVIAFTAKKLICICTNKIKIHFLKKDTDFFSAGIFLITVLLVSFKLLISSW